jgi:hypothetical protein
MNMMWKVCEVNPLAGPVEETECQSEKSCSTPKM